MNAVGLNAQALARQASGVAAQHVVPQPPRQGQRLQLGHAITIQPRSSAAVAAGMGLHATPELGGQVEFGPDVQRVQHVDKPDMCPARYDKAHGELPRFWPDLMVGALQPSKTGIQPKLRNPSGLASDVVIEGPEEHGVGTLAKPFVTELPRLTASLAIAQAMVPVLAW